MNSKTYTLAALLFICAASVFATCKKGGAYYFKVY